MLSTEEVQHIARLARVGLEEKEIEKLRTDLSAVLDSFRELEQADVTGVPAEGLLPGRQNSLRDDVPSVPDSNERDRIVSLFPRKEGNALKVKAVF